MKFAVFSRVIQVVLTEKMAFEQSLEGSVGEEHSRRGKHSTIPEVAGCPECPRNSEKDCFREKHQRKQRQKAQDMFRLSCEAELSFLDLILLISSEATSPKTQTLVPRCPLSTAVALPCLTLRRTLSSVRRKAAQPEMVPSFPMFLLDLFAHLLYLFAPVPKAGSSFLLYSPTK